MKRDALSKYTVREQNTACRDPKLKVMSVVERDRVTRNLVLERVLNSSTIPFVSVRSGSDESSKTVADCGEVTARFGSDVKCAVTWLSMDYNKGL